MTKAGDLNMGYGSEIVVGMEKTYYLEYASTFPKLLVEYKPETVGECVYWRIPDINWYIENEYPDIQECDSFFNTLAELPYKDKRVFGAVRVGLNFHDTEEWGSPHQYEIFINLGIASPIDQAKGETK